VLVDPLKETTVGGVRKSLWILFGSVSLLLLIACTNIVSFTVGAGDTAATRNRRALFAGRFTRHNRGATSDRIICACGVGCRARPFGRARSGGHISHTRREFATREEIHLDLSVVLYALACSDNRDVAVRLFPALCGTKRGLSGTLAQSSRTQVSGRNRLQFLLVGVQVALA